MEPVDPFHWIVEECRMSPSTERAMRNAPFFGASDSDSSAESISITKLSPPDSSEDDEIVETPPKCSSTAAASRNLNRKVGNRFNIDAETVPEETPTGVFLRSPKMSDDDSEKWVKYQALSPGGTPELGLQSQNLHEAGIEAEVPNGSNPTAAETEGVHHHLNMP